MVLIGLPQHEGCTSSTEKGETERGTSEAEAKPERNSLNLNRCISHDSAELSHHMPQSPCFVSTNQEVQTRQGLPHQPPILQINPSKCHWNVTARQGRVKTKGKLQTPPNFLTGGWGVGWHCLVHHRRWKLMSFTLLFVDRGCLSCFHMV